jgi:hypothetical protein
LGNLEWFLNNVSNEGPTVNGVATDGDDAIFGDYGNDWLVGGTGRDTLWGDWGNDLLNADDVLNTNGNANDQPDTNTMWEDRAVGGAGLDVLIGNTGGDRLIDWVGEFNSFIVPFSPFGIATVSRQVPPGLFEFLYSLSRAQGADRTLGQGGDPRNGEPFGEAGIVTQKDDAWQDQTGGPRDPQPGNVPGGKRDVLRGADFNDATTLDGFFVDSGSWTVSGSALQVAAASLGHDAAAVFYVDDYLPIYYEISASIRTMKPTGGWKANAYLIFDYFSPTDFKFAGIDISTNAVVMGHRDANGWVVDVRTPWQLRFDTFYSMLLAVNGTTVTLSVDGQAALGYTFPARYIDGVRNGLNKGMVGMGSDNARGSFDNVRVQILPPQVTLDSSTDLTTTPGPFGTPTAGSWVRGSTGETGTAVSGTSALLPVQLSSRLASTSWLQITAKVATAGIAGILFDGYADAAYKFAVIDIPGQRVLLGHFDTRHGWVVDAALSMTLVAGQAYTLDVQLKGASASLSVNGVFAVSTGYNAGVVDGTFGLLTRSGSATFASIRVRTDEPAFISSTPPPPGPEPITVSVDPAASVSEGNSGTRTVTLTVTLSRAPVAGETVRVPWSLADLTASFAEGDYALASGVLNFATGQIQLFITVTVNGDTRVEGNEVFTVQLGAATGATISQGVGRVTIVDDDTAPPPPPTPTISIDTVTATEGRSGTQNVTVTIRLSATRTSSTTVTVTIGGGTATAGSDYVTWSPVSRTVTIPAGSLTATVTVGVIGDRTAEADETVRLTLSNPVGATLGTAVGGVTIADDDSRLVASAVGPGAAAIDASDVSAALSAAVATWRAAGAATGRLDRVHVVVTDLAGTDLAQVVGSTLWLDADAAGWGWSLDSRGPAAGRMDLLTVLMHELGHVLGLEHDETGLMAAVLSPGTRELPTELPGVTAAARTATATETALASASALPTASAASAATAPGSVAAASPVVAVPVRLGRVTTNALTTTVSGAMARLLPGAAAPAGSSAPLTGGPVGLLLVLLGVMLLATRPRRYGLLATLDA